MRTCIDSSLDRRNHYNMQEGVTAKRAASDTFQTRIQIIGCTLDRARTAIDQ